LNEGQSLNKLVYLFFGLVTIGTLGFMAMGDGDIWLAFYRTTIILLTHVEHGVDDSFAKQILIIFLVLGSYFIVAYLIRVIGEYFMGGEFMKTEGEER
jgi:NADH:ubiquinone oxidoreductase subunit 5 (subunit L)/multisubunit Na+/H+ antiporter MnhA subunit